ncbi:metallothiol transferase FosB-like isoform X2 [Tripterygium wilfordii]|uniref:metallothiol transferase FosB-like isoform X2 n=1 Tax=Tripterygium wilfordii TaxID=458696 RepID=UPI0018F83918|nr:metallothiol transferase FosB-like isoform X2 [Tripterygium wilfordii]
MADQQRLVSSSPSPSTTTTSTSPLLSLNHVSFVVNSVSTSVRFYEDVLGFVVIKRPSSFNFEGAWLFNYGIGIHLLESDNITAKKHVINPKDNHISFQCSDMRLLVLKLEEMKIDYVTASVEEGGIRVDQLFFHDPDGYMIEICNCNNLPVLPLSASPLRTPDTHMHESCITILSREEKAGDAVLRRSCSRNDGNVESGFRN